MMAASLRKIERDLTALASDPDPISHEAVKIAARRIGAQAEMIERGLAE
jgi:hypothetical protein